MNFQDLRYFIAVAKHNHFRLAAEECHVSQPTLSQQLKKLEEFLGVKLFERTNKQVIITPIGKKILHHAHLILDHRRQIEHIAEGTSDPLNTSITLGLIPTVAPYYLPNIMCRLQEQAPNLTVYLREEQTATLLKKLTQGDIDVAILALPVDNEHLVCVPLFEEPFLLTVAPQHPLSDKHHVTLEDLKNQPLLLLDDGHCLRDQILDVCALAHVNEHPSFRATSLETLRYMIRSNAGITLMPNMAYRDDDRLVYIPFTEPQPSRTIGMVWRPTTPKLETLRRLRNLFKDSQPESAFT
jgi:LysR family hydrogen peroxide-inducible transcriptional activator